MKKIKIYASLLLTFLLTSCELYLDQLETPATAEEGKDPKKDLVTEKANGAEISYTYAAATTELTDQYDQYIIINEGDSILYYRDDTPIDFLPKPGDVLFSRMREKFPAGLARKVTQVKKENGMFGVHTDKAYYTEVFTALDLDLTNCELPISEYVNYANQTEPAIRIPGASRAPGDVKIVDGLKFDRVTNWEFHLTGGDDFDFLKYFSGSVSGDLTINIQHYEAILSNKISIFDGFIDVHHIAMIVCTLSGTATIGGKASFKPFEKLVQAQAQATALEGGLAGHVLYPDITITLEAGVEFSGTYTQTWVFDIVGKVNDFSISRESGIFRIEDKYDAGVSETTGSITGSISLTIDIDLRFGAAVAGGVAESGAYFKMPIKFGIARVNDKNAKDIVAPLESGERTYHARKDNNLNFSIELTDVGQYFRVGVPYAMQGAFKGLGEVFGEKTSFSANDVIKLEPDFEKLQGIVYINYLAVAKLILKFDSKIEASWPFFPVINSKNVILKCQNVDDPNRVYNRILGLFYFDEAGLYDYEQFELLVFDNQDRFVMSVPCSDSDTIVTTKENKPYVYSFNVDIPLIWDAEYDDNYYKVYPAYREKSKILNPGAAPGDASWTFYCDREFKVKNYRPCANLRKAHQTMFYIDEPDDRYIYYNYCVRSYLEIYSSPQITEWGLMVYLKWKKVSITEENMNECRKIGTYFLYPDENGNRNYLNSEGTTSIDFVLASKRMSLNSNYLYLVPFYKDPSKSKPTVLYDDGVALVLQDDEELEYFYQDELNEPADQNFAKE